MADFVLQNERDRSRLLAFIAGLSLAKPKRITLADIRSRRSDAQNRLLWLWNNEIQTHMREAFGQIASAEEWHSILVSRLWPSELRPVRLPDGTSYKVGRAKTSKFTVDQMAEYLTLLDAYCAENLSLLLPHPDDLLMAAYGKRAA